MSVIYQIFEGPADTLDMKSSEKYHGLMASTL